MHVRPSIVVLLAAAGLFVASCGDEATGQRASEGSDAAATPAETPEPTPTPEPDRDNDGAPDADDYAPKNNRIQTKADAEDCDVLGINAAQRKEGACTNE